MDNWDEAKLEEVVDQKHGESNKKMPQTAIVSHSDPFFEPFRWFIISRSLLRVFVLTYAAGRELPGNDKMVDF